MDVYCTRCGEPWDVVHVLHEDPSGFVRNGGLIRHCPSCPQDEPKLTPETRGKLATVAVMAQILGNDIDGLAAALADSGLF